MVHGIQNDEIELLNKIVGKNIKSYKVEWDDKSEGQNLILTFDNGFELKIGSVAAYLESSELVIEQNED